MPTKQTVHKPQTTIRLKTENKISGRVTAFDRSRSKSEEWVNEIQSELNWLSADNVYHLLRAVLHTIRDQLNINEAAHFSAQLPMLLRGTFYECWDPKSSKTSGYTKEEFMDSIRKNLEPVNRPNYDLEAAVKVVLRCIMSHISPGEMSDVIQASKPSLKSFYESITNFNIGNKYQ